MHNLFSQYTDSSLLSTEAYNRWFNELQKNQSFILCGIVEYEPGKAGMQLIGLASLWMHPKYYKNNGKIGYIEDVIIDKQHTTKELENKLIDFTIKEGKKRGCFRINLNN